MGKSPSSWNCSKHEEPLKRGVWTDSEDKILCEYIKTHGVGRWRSLPKKAGIKRCGKSCRLRWLNYLRPEIKRGNISPEEEELLIRLHRLLGNRWSLIAGRLPGRTDNEIKNYWNTHLSKRIQMGEFEPKFQKPFQRRDIPSSSNYDEEGVLNNDSYTPQNLPLKTIAVSYRGRVTADVLNYSNNNYELIQDTHDSINNKKRLKAAGDHALEIDTSKSWCQLLLEDCMGDYQYDRLETITDLQPNSMISTGHGIDDDHQSPSPSLSRSIILQKNHPSSYCNLFDPEFPNSRDFNSSYFESFLDMGDMGELPSLPP